MHRAVGPVHVHSVLLVEMFYLLVVLLQNFILKFLVFQPNIWCGYSKEPSK